MGLLEEIKQIEAKMSQINDKLNYYIIDGDLKHRAAYINDSDGCLHVFNEKIQTKEESKALCQWYLSVCDEL